MGFYIHFISPQLILTIIPRKMDSLGPVTVTGLITNTVSVPHCNVICSPCYISSDLLPSYLTTKPGRCRSPQSAGRHHTTLNLAV